MPVHKVFADFCASVSRDTIAHDGADAQEEFIEGNWTPTVTSVTEIWPRTRGATSGRSIICYQLHVDHGSVPEWNHNLQPAQ
jgi:hypothetical protein